MIKQTTADDVRKTIETSLTSGGIDSSQSEIAFFGGSFTAIDREYMISLLQAANEYVVKFKGIRISTRPDCINEEILDILKTYNVTTIELGAQSMSDRVLTLNQRGHNSECVRTASKLIKSYGFSLGLQMMTGLYASSEKLDYYTAEEFIKLSPQNVRIYPTVVLEGTKLYELFLSGEYTPQSVDNAVTLCSDLIVMFETAGIDVIRVGLHSSDTLESSIVGGAYHPAFRELCESAIFYNRIIELININKVALGEIIIKVSPKSISKVIGQKKKNIIALERMGYKPMVVSDANLSQRQILIQEG